MLSRGIAGIRGNTLIVNLPGSSKGARENLGVLLPILEHTVEENFALTICQATNLMGSGWNNRNLVFIE